MGYVGHIFTSQGLKADPDKTAAFTIMPVHTDVTSLQCGLGMGTYLAKFIPNFSNIIAPLRTLIHEHTEWCWIQQHQEAFDRLKSCLSNPPVLAYHDVKQPVTLTCDASCSGLGAACMQKASQLRSPHTPSQIQRHYTHRYKESCWLLCLAVQNSDNMCMESPSLWKQTTSP